MTALRISLLAAILAVGAAVPASAASRLVVSGAGFGHGIGMSQYGAMGYAQQGADHGTILTHYFTGTQLGRLGGASEVRVLLKTSRQMSFSGAAGVAGGRSLDPAQTYTAVRSLGAAMTLRSASGRDLGSYQAPLAITGSGDGLLVRGRADNDVVSGRYRGNLELRPSAIGGVAAINAVGLEDYLRGVVPGEMPPAWPAEALRAQAVAARTYAIATSKSGDGFEQYADTRSQMYTGIAGERPSTDAAVAATRDEIVVYDGKPIVTYYFSTSGGQTENVENSFLGADPAPWLVSVEDPYDAASPRHRWTKRMTLRGAKRRLGSLLKGQLRQIKVLRRGRSPRVVRAEIVGTGGRTRVNGPQLRSKLGLYDTWARFTVITSRSTRGDGNRPTAAPGGSTTTGGTTPRIFARFSAVALPVAGTIRGRVTGAAAGSLVFVQRHEPSGWVTQLTVPARAGGIYAADVLRPGLYRVRHGGAAGPVVRVR
ncbi:MAG TPA: SpoIID/LytB domain-containing protein [Solirubrobacteraceae bacterium]|nr:SpoIID/LytB domain-containing protein [Solirubrobacteraceae bacterium]